MFTAVFEVSKKLILIKKMAILRDGHYKIILNKQKGVIEARYTLNDRILIGLFNVESKVGTYKFILENTNLNNGEYINLITDKTFEVNNSFINLSLEPIIFEVRC